jgi:hypothetical protein
MRYFTLIKSAENLKVITYPAIDSLSLQISLLLVRDKEYLAGLYARNAFVAFSP